MGEGLVTLDHTRAAVALELGIGSIPVRVHGIDESLLSSMTGRFGDSIIWGETVAYRSGNQNPKLPPLGTTTPLVFQSRKNDSRSTL